MSDNGSNMQPVRPLTRREIREREQAAAAEREARSTGDGGAPATSWASPSAQPAGPPPSRRSLRETTGATQYPSQPSVVRPPSSSGGMRGLDETGRLTPVQETAERVTIRPPATPAQPPTRTSSRPAPNPVRLPGPSGPTPAPGASAPTRAPGASGVTRAPGAPGVTRAPGASGPVRPPTPVRGATPVARVSTRGTGAQGMFDHAAGLGAPATAPSWASTEPAPESPVPHRESVNAPERRAALPQPSAGQRASTEPAAAAALPWSAITAGGAPQRAVPSTQAPLGQVGQVADPVGTPATDDLFPRVHADSPARRAEADDEHETDAARGPSYTWLHYLILVAVAFVLGLLVWELISSDSAGPSTSGHPVVVDQVADATSGTSGTGR